MVEICVLHVPQALVDRAPSPPPPSTPSTIMDDYDQGPLAPETPRGFKRRISPPSSPSSPCPSPKKKTTAQPLFSTGSSRETQEGDETEKEPEEARVYLEDLMGAPVTPRRKMTPRRK